MKYLTFLFLIVSLIACSGKTKFDKPENLIPKDSMIDLLTQMHLASGANSVKNLNDEKEKPYISLVYEKYNIDSVRFFESNVYYTSKIDEQKEIYEKVEKKLLKLKELYTTENDSIEQSIIDSIEQTLPDDYKR